MPTIAIAILAFTLATVAPQPPQDRPDLSGQWNEAETTGAGPWGSEFSLRQRGNSLVVQQPRLRVSEYRFDGVPVVEAVRSTPCQQRLLSKEAAWNDDRLVLTETTTERRCTHQPVLPLATDDPEETGVMLAAEATRPDRRVVFEIEIVLSLSDDVLTVEVVRRSAGGGELVSSSKYLRGRGTAPPVNVVQYRPL